MLNRHTSPLEFEDRIDVEYADWLHQKNHILALQVTCRVQFAAIIILALALGFLMVAEPSLHTRPFPFLFIEQ